MSNFDCAIVREIAVLSSNANGWQLELNEVSWNGAAPKLDLRRWAPEHARQSKGLTLTRSEAKAMYAALEKELADG